MAIITTVETLPARAGRPAETLTRVSGEIDYVRPKRLESPQAPKQVPLKLNELRDLLAWETAGLAFMDAEIKQISARSTEVRLKLSNNERALATAQDQHKTICGLVARGQGGDEKKIALSQSAIRDIEDQISSFKSIAQIIQSDLLELTAPREQQQKRVTGLTQLVWEAIEQAELEKLKPVLIRALTAGMKGRSRSSQKFIENLSGLINHPSMDQQNRDCTAAIAAEYGIPKY